MIRNIAIVLLLCSSSVFAQTAKPGEVCHTVVDNTRVNLVYCGAFATEEYVCPRSGEPCYSFIAKSQPPTNCGQVTKQVCGPPEMFHDEDPQS